MLSGPSVEAQGVIQSPPLTRDVSHDGKNGGAIWALLFERTAESGGERQREVNSGAVPGISPGIGLVFCEGTN